jgi:hypothetical protein
MTANIVRLTRAVAVLLAAISITGRFIIKQSPEDT